MDRARCSSHEKSFQAPDLQREPPSGLAGSCCSRKDHFDQDYLEKLSGQDLVLDISSDPDDRIYGEDWFSFMKSGKAVAGLEGGASIFDFDESAEKEVRNYLQENPSATYEQIHAACLSSIEGNVIYRMITPRSFEAISMKTVQVMYPGIFGDFGSLEALPSHGAGFFQCQ